MLIDKINLVRTIFPFEEKTVAKKIFCCLKIRFHAQSTSKSHFHLNY